MLKFKSRDEGVLKINKLFLEGFSKEDLRQQFGLTSFEKKSIFNGKQTSVTVYCLNGKIGTKYSDGWTWREKLFIDLLG